VALKELINLLGSGKLLELSMLQDSSAELGLTLRELFDLLSREVAESYLRGDHSWEFCDNAMNFLFGSWSRQAAIVEIPDLMHGIFLAFDAGEMSTDPDVITKPLLQKQL